MDVISHGLWGGIASLLILICSLLACGGDGGGGGGGNGLNPSLSAGCENGIAGYYTITYNDCPACNAYPGRSSHELVIWQTGVNLQFRTTGGLLIFTGKIDTDCTIKTDNTLNDVQYYCNGTWTNGKLELICDDIMLLDGTCTQRSTLR